MPASTPNEIMARFAALYRAAPPLYEQMLLEFERFEDDCLRSIFQADNSSILQAQGVAKQTAYILTLLKQAKTYVPPIKPVQPKP